LKGRRRDVTARLPVEKLAQVRAPHWIAIAAAILLLDYVTGPFIQFTILFVIPVALATATHGRVGGIAVAVLLPLLRLSLYFWWGLPDFFSLELLDTGTDIVVLAGFSLLIHEIVRQQREIRVLQGMLPICAFCKRIRDEKRGWQQLESFITERSAAQFSHTLCQECIQKHYAGLTE
jgi:hypothetical protein